MGLFSTPDYAGLIWKPQQFPEESGIEGLISGVSGGMKVGAQYKADKKAWNDKEASRNPSKSTQNWGEVGGTPETPNKPNPFKYYFGMGAAKQSFDGSSMSSGSTPGMNYSSGSGQSTSDLVAAIEQLISEMRTQINR